MSLAPDSSSVPESSEPHHPQALDGIRVLEMGQLIAGPFAARLLGEFGAEVIKIEPPGTGDPLRKWRLLDETGNSVWWAAQSRNKQSVALDLRQGAAQDLVRRLLVDCDVLIENFRPGTLEQWGLGWDEISKINPGLILLRVSGYGQDGPYRDRPGFGVVAEAMGGLRHLCGEPGRTPVRVGVSIGDSLAGLHGVIGVLLALRHRDQTPGGGRGRGGGQVIDVALYEAVFSMMESLIPEYSAFGAVRQAAGSSLPGIAPTNAYRCQDGRYALIAGNGDSIFRRLMALIGRPDLGADPLLAHNDGRVAQVERLDAAIAEWAAQHPLDAVLDALNGSGIPAGKIYDAADIAHDPHYLARGMLRQTRLPSGKTVTVPGVVPRLSATPGTLRTEAPRLGEHTDQVLRGMGLSDAQIATLRQQGIVG